MENYLHHIIMGIPPYVNIMLYRWFRGSPIYTNLHFPSFPNSQAWGLEVLQGNCEVSRLEFKTCDQKKHGEKHHFRKIHETSLSLSDLFFSTHWIGFLGIIRFLFSRFFNMLKPWNLRNVTWNQGFNQKWISLSRLSPRLGSNWICRLTHWPVPYQTVVTILLVITLIIYNYSDNMW